MRVLATGPEASGTTILTHLLAAGGADALHRSQPEGPDWIDVEAMLDDFDHTVVIVRGLVGNLASLQRKGLAETPEAAAARRRKALSRLAPILGHPRVTVVTYESLREPAERRALLAGLGLDPAGADAIDWTDENRKYYA